MAKIAKKVPKNTPNILIGVLFERSFWGVFLCLFYKKTAHIYILTVFFGQNMAGNWGFGDFSLRFAPYYKKFLQ